MPNKSDTIADHRLHDTDTGSPEVQIALLTERINHLTEHLSSTRRTITAAGACSCWSAAGAGCSTTCRTPTSSATGPSSPSSACADSTTDERPRGPLVS